MPDLTKDYIKSQKPWIKIAMKGRPMWFGVQAKSKVKGIFRISKKKGEVTKQKLLDGKPFDESGKDSEEGKNANEGKDIGTKASMGVCQKGAAGQLKLMVVKGGLTETNLEFVRLFITKTLKLKSVKEVVLAEVGDESQLPKVDENEKAPEQITAASVGKRIEELRKRLTAAGGNAEIGKELDTAKSAASAPEKLEEVDDSLDDTEDKIAALEAKAKGGGGAALNGKLVTARKSWGTASAAVDKQLEALKAAMLKENDEQLKDIANYGLTGVDGGFRFKLNTALTEVEKAGDAAAQKKASATAQTAMKELLKHLGGDDRVKVIADPPNGWPKVNIKDTINPALKELADALK